MNNDKFNKVIETVEECLTVLEIEENNNEIIDGSGDFYDLRYEELINLIFNLGADKKGFELYYRLKELIKLALLKGYKKGVKDVYDILEINDILESTKNNNE